MFALLALLAAAPPIYAAPAGDRPAQFVPGGETILPNGRLVTPHGKRLYTGEDLWKVALSPDGRTLATIHDGGMTFHDLGNLSAHRSYVRKEIAPAMVFDKTGDRLWVSLGDDGALECLNPRDGSTIKKIALERGSYLNDFVLSADGHRAYGVDIAHQDLLTIDLEAGKVVGKVKAGREPYAIVGNADSLTLANIGLFDYSPIPGKGLTRPPFAFPSVASEKGVLFEGRQIPGLGSPYVPDAQSVWRFDLKSGSPVLAGQAKSGLLIHAPADGGKSVGGSAPNALLELNGRLYVSNANNDTISVFDAKTLKLAQTIKLAPLPDLARLRGVIPNSLAASPDGKTLYVCEGGLNAVGVVEVATGKVRGHIPTGWFPTSIAVAKDGRTLYIGTQKGIGRGPRGPKAPRPSTDERAGFTDMPGMVDVLTTPSTGELKGLTQEVLRNNGLVAVAQRPVPNLPKEIQYVVFITKENHSFDGIFGTLEGANGEPDYAEWGECGWIAEKGKAERVAVMPNHLKLARQFAISDNFYMEPQASGDGHRWLVGVYPSLWTTRVYYAGWNFAANKTMPGRMVSFGSNGSQIPEDYLENGSLWEHLERGGVGFRNYGEGFEFPGVGEDDGEAPTGASEVGNFPMPKALFDHTCFGFPIFNTNIPDVFRSDWFIKDLEDNYRKKGKAIPRFLNVALCNDHGTGARPDRGYPYVCSYMADNDLALGQVVEYLTHLPEWKHMAIFVTQDDSGGDNDHVDRHRSYVLAISPYAKKHYVDHAHTSIMSILRTIYETFGLPANNLFDAVATPLGGMFTSVPDFTPYTHSPSDLRVFDPAKTFDPLDPEFKRRRQEKLPVQMDDPNFVDWLRKRG